MEVRNNRKNGKRGKDAGLGGILKGFVNFWDLIAEPAEEREAHKRERMKLGFDIQYPSAFGSSLSRDGNEKTVADFSGEIEGDAGNGLAAEGVREPLVDLFDEMDRFIVVVELPGIEEADIGYRINGDMLSISAGKADWRFRKELLLPEPIDGQSVNSSYRNGILELELPKAAK